MADEERGLGMLKPLLDDQAISVSDFLQVRLYSKAQADGAWKSIELSAEASLNAKEEWQEAQAELYSQLGQQLKAFWTTKANGQASGNGQSEHYCIEHSLPFKRHSKDGKTWYSHKQGSGWCNERS